MKYLDVNFPGEPQQQDSSVTKSRLVTLHLDCYSHIENTNCLISRLEDLRRLVGAIMCLISSSVKWGK